MIQYCILGHSLDYPLLIIQSDIRTRKDHGTDDDWWEADLVEDRPVFKMSKPVLLLVLLNPEWNDPFAWMKHVTRKLLFDLLSFVVVDVS